jgi:hypothetical protein
MSSACIPAFRVPPRPPASMTNNASPNPDHTVSPGGAGSRSRSGFEQNAPERIRTSDLRFRRRELIRVSSPRRSQWHYAAFTGPRAVPHKPRIARTPAAAEYDPNVSDAHVCAHSYNPRPGTNVSGPLKRETLTLYGLRSSSGRQRPTTSIPAGWAAQRRGRTSGPSRTTPIPRASTTTRRTSSSSSSIG